MMLNYFFIHLNLNFIDLFDKFIIVHLNLLIITIKTVIIIIIKKKKKKIAIDRLVVLSLFSYFRGH